MKKFKNENANKINVEPSILLSILVGDFENVSAVFIDSMCLEKNDLILIRCDDLDVAIVSFGNGQESSDLSLKAVHCDRPYHGIHKRFTKSSAYQKVKKYFKRPDDKCDKCSGDCWIDANSEDGRQLISGANAIKMFRGIRLAEDGYKPEQLQYDKVRDSVVSFLSGEKIPSASSAAGTTDENGRPRFNKKSDGENYDQ